MTELQEALRIVSEEPNRGLFAGPRDPALITAAERALGGSLPPTYREFATRLGAGNFGGFEVYGIIDNNFENSSVPNGVWLTLTERIESGLPDNLAIIGSTGDGDYYCIALASGEESPVILYQPGLGADQQRWEQVAQDFGEFLRSGVIAEL
jgi:hypothetical protein